MKKRTRTPNSQPDQISRVCTYFNHYNLFGFIFSAISTYGKKEEEETEKKYGVNYAVRKQTKENNKSFAESKFGAFDVDVQRRFSVDV